MKSTTPTTLSEFATGARVATDGGVLADGAAETDSDAAYPDAYEFEEGYSVDTYTHRETGLVVELSRHSNTDQWDDGHHWKTYVRPAAGEPTLGVFEYERFEAPTYEVATQTAHAFMNDHPDGVVEQ